jgi:hypothetical protein
MSDPDDCEPINVRKIWGEKKRPDRSDPPTDYPLAAITALKNRIHSSQSWLDIVTMISEHFATITLDKFYIIQDLGDKISLISKDTFITQFANCKMAFDTDDSSGDKKKVNVAIYWLNSQRVRECDEYLFDPEHAYVAKSPIFNKWRGFATHPIKGDCGKLLSYLLNDICNGNEKIKYPWLMSWCAHMFQRPWEKPEIALALEGPKGIGKSLLFWILKWLLDGPTKAGKVQKYYHKVSKSKGLLPRFNVHLEENILLVSEEISLVGDKELIGAMTDFITSDTVTVEIKNGPIRDVKSYSRVGTTINDGHFVPATGDERRWAVFRVSDAHQEQKPYWNEIIQELKNGGAEALMYVFMNWDISDFNPRKCPETDELGDQKIDSLKGVTRWWYNKLCTGRLPLFERLEPGHNGPCKVITEKVQNDYLRLEKDAWLRTNFSTESFGKQLRRVCPDFEKKDKIPNMPAYNLGSKANWVNVYTFPSLNDCRATFLRSQKIRNIEWDENVTEWDADLTWIIDGPF